MDLAGKVAIVTGGAGGLGLGFVQVLLENKCKVCFCDINEEAGCIALDDLKVKHGEDTVIFKTCDVTKEEQLNDVFEATLEKFHQLDIVVNNAGVLTEKDWERMLSINTVAMIRGTYLAFRHMDVHNGGHGGVVLNVSSVAGVFTSGLCPVYCASKHGIKAFSQSIALCSVDLYGVRVNTLCPGGIDTDLYRRMKDSANIPTIFYPPNCEEEVAQVMNAYPTETPRVYAELALPLIKEGNGRCQYINPEGIADIPTVLALSHMEFKPLPNAHDDSD